MVPKTSTINPTNHNEPLVPDTVFEGILWTLAMPYRSLHVASSLNGPLRETRHRSECHRRHALETLRSRRVEPIQEGADRRAASKRRPRGAVGPPQFRWSNVFAAALRGEVEGCALSTKGSQVGSTAESCEVYCIC